MSGDVAYSKAPDSLIEVRDDLVRAMDEHMADPLAVSAEAARDALSGESLGTEASYGISIENAMGGGPSWTLSDYHNFKMHGLVSGSRFLSALAKLASGE